MSFRHRMPVPCRALALAATLAFGGCALAPGTPQPDPAAKAAVAPHGEAHRIDALQAAIQGLGPGVDATEARTVAEVAVTYPLELAREYRLTTPPLWHNTLVNFGIKPRGLCVDWTRDMLVRLQQLRLRTLELHWAVANFEAVFRIEHSTAVVGARGRPLAAGIVLDPWRNSGRLFWAPVTADPEYRWQPLADVQAARSALEAQRAENRLDR